MLKICFFLSFFFSNRVPSCEELSFSHHPHLHVALFTYLFSFVAFPSFFVKVRVGFFDRGSSQHRSETARVIQRKTPVPLVIAYIIPDAVERRAPSEARLSLLTSLRSTKTSFSSDGVVRSPGPAKFETLNEFCTRACVQRYESIEREKKRRGE